MYAKLMNTSGQVAVLRMKEGQLSIDPAQREAVEQSLQSDLATFKQRNPGAPDEAFLKWLATDAFAHHAYTWVELQD